MTYQAEYFQTNSRGSSDHLLADLAEFLNQRAKEGWLLHTMTRVSIGFLLVFEK